MMPQLYINYKVTKHIHWRVWLVFDFLLHSHNGAVYVISLQYAPLHTWVKVSEWVVSTKVGDLTDKLSEIQIYIGQATARRSDRHSSGLWMISSLLLCSNTRRWGSQTKVEIQKYIGQAMTGVNDRWVHTAGLAAKFCEQKSSMINLLIWHKFAIRTACWHLPSSRHIMRFQNGVVYCGELRDCWCHEQREHVD